CEYLDPKCTGSDTRVQSHAKLWRELQWTAGSLRGLEGEDIRLSQLRAAVPAVDDATLRDRAYSASPKRKLYLSGERKDGPSEDRERVGSGGGEWRSNEDRSDRSSGSRHQQ